MAKKNLQHHIQGYYYQKEQHKEGTRIRKSSIRFIWCCVLLGWKMEMLFPISFNFSSQKLLPIYFEASNGWMDGARGERRLYTEDEERMTKMMSGMEICIGKCGNYVNTRRKNKKTKYWYSYSIFLLLLCFSIFTIIPYTHNMPTTKQMNRITFFPFFLYTYFYYYHYYFWGYVCIREHMNEYDGRNGKIYFLFSSVKILERFTIEMGLGWIRKDNGLSWCWVTDPRQIYIFINRRGTEYMGLNDLRWKSDYHMLDLERDWLMEMREKGMWNWKKDIFLWIYSWFYNNNNNKKHIYRIINFGKWRRYEEKEIQLFFLLLYLLFWAFVESYITNFIFIFLLLFHFLWKNLNIFALRNCMVVDGKGYCIYIHIHMYIIKK